MAVGKGENDSGVGDDPDTTDCGMCFGGQFGPCDDYGANRARHQHDIDNQHDRRRKTATMK